MKKLVQSLTGGYSSSAKVIDGTLILSLPDALNPSVWRMDLGHVKSSALEVRQGDDGSHILILKTPREDIHTIAPFGSRAQAVRALMAVSRAMEQAQGRTRPAAAANDDQFTSRRPLNMGKWITGVIALFILVIALKFLFTMGPSTNAMSTADSGSAPVSANTAGVPLSADDFLRQRQ